MKASKTKLLNEIKQAKKGNQIAFNFLLEAFWEYVYNYQLGKVKNEEDAEDITIQTFSKAFDNIDKFNEEYQFKTWLIAISKNVLFDFLRKKQNLVSVKITKEQQEKVYRIVDDSPTPEDTIIREQNLAKLLRDIKQLKPKYQKIIHLRFFQELSYKEIAEVTNEPLNNVKVKLLRAKKILSEIIKKN